MNRDEKSATIDEIAAQIRGSEAIFAVDYRGISVPQAAELRSKLRDFDASFRVVKNRLTKLAADKAGEGRLAELLQGPTALAFIRGDTAQAAKTISNFNRDHEVLIFKGGFMEGLTLDEEKFRSIARLPSRDVLNGQFAGVVASPLTGLVRGLGSLISGLALQLGQIVEQGLVSGSTPAPEPGTAVHAEAAPGEGPTETPTEEEPAADAGDSAEIAASASAEPTPDETSDTDDEKEEE